MLYMVNNKIFADQNTQVFNASTATVLTLILAEYFEITNKN